MSLDATKAAADTAAANEILEILSNTVLAIGEILEQVYVERPSFCDFVTTSLPMRPQTAERVRAMYLVHSEHSGHPDLPEPWKALWNMG
jgi:hypothetical protein